MTRVSIIGAGNSGLTMAAHLSLEGNEVFLWNRSPDKISELSLTKCVHCHGIIEQDARIRVVSSDIREVVSGTDIILITTPADSHRELARLLKPYLSKKSCIILNPGRTLGALEFKTTLLQEGCTTLPLIAEAQTIIYTCRKIDPVSVNLIAFKKDVLISAINPKDTTEVIDRLPRSIRPYFIPAKSMIQTSIGNVGMILHCAPVLLNAGWIECPKTAFKYYYDGITPTVAGFLEKLDRERLEVSRLLGEDVESTADWLRRSYGIEGDTLFECIQNNQSYKTIDAPTTLRHRYIFEDIPCGLVPLEAVGKRLGLPMKSAGMVIDFASSLLNVNLRETGRNLERLGLNSKSKAEIAKIIGNT
jgi:opine dehydrogenase